MIFRIFPVLAVVLATTNIFILLTRTMNDRDISIERVIAFFTALFTLSMLGYYFGDMKLKDNIINEQAAIIEEYENPKED